MKIIYDYIAKRDSAEPEKGSVLIMRMIGGFWIVSAIIYYFTLAKEINILDYLVMGSSVVFGILSLLVPKMFLKPFLPKGEHITIDEEKISWRIKPDRNTKTILRAEIEKITFYVGQIHFKTTSGEKYILESHKIYNPEKYKELGEILKDIAKSINSKVNV